MTVRAVGTGGDGRGSSGRTAGTAEKTCRWARCDNGGVAVCRGGSAPGGAEAVRGSARGEFRGASGDVGAVLGDVDAVRGEAGSSGGLPLVGRDMEERDGIGCDGIAWEEGGPCEAAA